MTKKIFSDKFTKYLDHFEKSTIGFVKVSKGRKHSNYYFYAKRIETILNIGNDSLVKWFDEEIESNSENPIFNLLQRYEKAQSLKELKDCYKTGFKKFAQSVIGIFYANTWLTIEDGQDKFFCELIAKNAIFASEEVVNKVKMGDLGTKNSKKECKKLINENATDKKFIPNPYASWDFMEHYRDNKRVKESKKKEDRKTEEENGDFIKEFPNINFLKKKVADDNTYANNYIKLAILESYPWLKDFKPLNFNDYEACHVWDKPTDRRYYASIMNLVLVPRALAQLTDHNKEVMALLRKRANDLFEFKPHDVKLQRSTYYETVTWRQI